LASPFEEPREVLFENVRALNSLPRFFIPKDTYQEELRAPLFEKLF
jgi:hypothetical protein